MVADDGIILDGPFADLMASVARNYRLHSAGTARATDASAASTANDGKGIRSVAGAYPR
jgi:hypothetical protein